MFVFLIKRRRINAYIIIQSITVFHFTLSKIILMKFAKLRTFVLSFIILFWVPKGVFDNTSVGMCVSDQQKMDS